MRACPLAVNSAAVNPLSAGASARAARTAVDDGAAAVLVDPGQSTQLVVTGSELDQLAAVWTEATNREGTDA